MGRKKKSEVLFVNDRTLYYNVEDEDINFVKPQYGEDYETVRKGTQFYCPTIKDRNMFDMSVFDSAIVLIPKSKHFALNFKSLLEAYNMGIKKLEDKK